MSVKVGSKSAPDGFDKIEPTLKEFQIELKNVQSKKASKLSVKANENLWEIMRIHHQQSRYIFNLYFKRKAISKELYDWLIKKKYADRFLIAKWKKQGYEKLCCLQCIQVTEISNGKTCICRIPRAQLEKDVKDKGLEMTFQQCVLCGCRGCSSKD